MSDYTLVIIITFIAFTALAALLLVPIYRFLRREEEASEKMTGHSVPEDFEIAPSVDPPEQTSGQPTERSDDRPERTSESDP